MKVIKYSAEYKSQWDNFVGNSKNGTFLHYRDYMDYHSDRFTDHSLIVFNDNDEIKALLPANKKENTLISHSGLTYGGLILDNKIKSPEALSAISSITDYLKLSGFSNFIYKAIPSVYHKIPSDEDLYAMFCLDAKLIDRKPSSTIFIPERIINKKKRGSAAIKAGYEVKEVFDLKAFWNLLEENLFKKYNVLPVHSLEEITKLKSLFPENIRCFCVCKDEEIISGALVYENHKTVHAQYTAPSEKGKSLHALDLLYDQLINHIYSDKYWFDFGTSAEPFDTRILNEGLVLQKEGFGARTTIYDIYELTF